jgi:acetylornithine deacetylase
VPGGAGERQAADHVAAWAHHAGLRVELLEGSPGRPSVVVRGGSATRGGRTLLLCGHLDTVGVGSMADPLVPRREGDRLLGRGGYDMKAGLAAALIACRDAGAAGIGGKVLVAAVADEEHSSMGVQEVLGHITADAAIVTEPTELAVGIAHRGFTWTEIEVVGKAAHGSRPQLGVDAILRTGPILVALDDLDRELRRRDHPIVGGGNLHASLIRGGAEESTIPDRCVVTIERRTVPGESVADVEADIADLLHGCRAADPDLAVSTRTTLSRPPFEADPRCDVVDTLTRAAAGVLGRSPDRQAVSYWSDAALIAAAGIPTVLFGPSGDGAHADHEWVDLPSVVTCAAILTATATQFCR